MSKKKELQVYSFIRKHSQSLTMERVNVPFVLKTMLNKTTNLLTLTIGNKIKNFGKSSENYNSRPNV